MGIDHESAGWSQAVDELSLSHHDVLKKMEMIRPCGKPNLVGGLEHGFYDFSIYWECHHSNWRTHIFQRGRYTVYHQPAIISIVSLPFGDGLQKL